MLRNLLTISSFINLYSISQSWLVISVKYLFLIINIGKWSEISLTIIPKVKFAGFLMKMWSINVAASSVILVSLAVVEIIEYDWTELRMSRETWLSLQVNKSV